MHKVTEQHDHRRLPKYRGVGSAAARDTHLVHKMSWCRLSWQRWHCVHSRLNRCSSSVTCALIATTQQTKIAMTLGLSSRSSGGGKGSENGKGSKGSNEVLSAPAPNNSGCIPRNAVPCRGACGRSHPPAAGRSGTASSPPPSSASCTPCTCTSSSRTA